MIIGDTPAQLGQIEAADAMMIDGKIVTRDQVLALTAERDALAAQLTAWNAAFDHLFAHCLSNGVFNAWGQQLDCTLLNNARSEPPQHHLRQVRADAVKTFTDDAIAILGEYQDVQVSSGRDTDAVDIEIIHAIESSKLTDYANQCRASILAGKE